MAKKKKTTDLLIDFSFSDINTSDFAILLSYSDLSFLDYKDGAVRAGFINRSECEKLKTELMTTANIESKIDEISQDYFLVYFNLNATVLYTVGEYIGLNVR